MPRPAAATREHILDRAYELFYRRGFARVGMDEIAEAAAVTKRTVYYHFESKDALLAAVLDHHGALALDRIRAWGEALPRDPDAFVDALFAAFADWATTPRWQGTGMTRLVMELADLPGHPARAIARRHKAAIEAWLAAALRARGISGGAPELTVLLEGTNALLLVHGDPAYAVAAAATARAVLRQFKGLDGGSRLLNSRDAPEDGSVEEPAGGPAGAAGDTGARG